MFESEGDKCCSVSERCFRRSEMVLIFGMLREEKDTRGGPKKDEGFAIVDGGS